MKQKKKMTPTEEILQYKIVVTNKMLNYWCMIQSN